MFRSTFDYICTSTTHGRTRFGKLNVLKYVTKWQNLYQRCKFLTAEQYEAFIESLLVDSEPTIDNHSHDEFHNQNDYFKSLDLVPIQKRQRNDSQPLYSTSLPKHLFDFPKSFLHSKTQSIEKWVSESCRYVVQPKNSMDSKTNVNCLFYKKSKLANKLAGQRVEQTNLTFNRSLYLDVQQHQNIKENDIVNEVNKVSEDKDLVDKESGDSIIVDKESRDSETEIRITNRKEKDNDKQISETHNKNNCTRYYISEYDGSTLMKLIKISPVTYEASLSLMTNNRLGTGLKEQALISELKKSACKQHSNTDANNIKYNWVNNSLCYAPIEHKDIVDMDLSDKESLSKEHEDKESVSNEYDNLESRRKEHDDKESVSNKHDDLESVTKEHEDKESLSKEHEDKESVSNAYDNLESVCKEHDEKESVCTEHDEIESVCTEHDGIESMCTEHEKIESGNKEYEKIESVSNEQIDKDSVDKDNENIKSVSKEHKDIESVSEEHEDIEPNWNNLHSSEEKSGTNYYARYFEKNIHNVHSMKLVRISPQMYEKMTNQLCTGTQEQELEERPLSVHTSDKTVITDDNYDSSSSCGTRISYVPTDPGFLDHKSDQSDISCAVVFNGSHLHTKVDRANNLFTRDVLISRKRKSSYKSINKMCKKRVHFDERDTSI